MPSSNVHAAKHSGRDRRNRRSISKSARNAILSLRANKSSSIRPAESNDSNGNTRERLKTWGQTELTFKYLKHLFLTATSWALSSSEDEILVGGQAVIEGVMMRSPKGYSVAVRRQDGSVRVIREVLQTVSEKWKLFKLPILRGVGVLGQALVL